MSDTTQKGGFPSSLGVPIPIKQFVVTVTGIVQQTVKAVNADEARGFVKGVLIARNPDFQRVNTTVKEIKLMKVETEKNKIGELNG